MKVIKICWTPTRNDLWIKHIVDGSEIRRSPVEVGSLSHYVQGCLYARWYRISSINSTTWIKRWEAPTFSFEDLRPLCKNIYIWTDLVEAAREISILPIGISVNGWLVVQVAYWNGLLNVLLVFFSAVDAQGTIPTQGALLNLRWVNHTKVHGWSSRDICLAPSSLIWWPSCPTGSSRSSEFLDKNDGTRWLDLCFGEATGCCGMQINKDMLYWILFRHCGSKWVDTQNEQT